MFIVNWIKRLFFNGLKPINFKKAESSLGYRFNDLQLLITSFKHRSYSQAVDGSVNLSNERFEFLGDSVLNMIVSHRLFVQHPEFQEGDLTKIKSNLVSKKSAVLAAKKIGLEKYILLNDSEENSGGRNRSSIIADTYEAVIGAIFLDGGYDAARNFVMRTLFDNVDYYLELETNYKSMLLEMVQGERMGHPVYMTVSETGPDHDKEFTVEVLVKGHVIGRGIGKNKKDAQQLSAKEGVEKLKELISGQ
jgi:ribonuclease III